MEDGFLEASVRAKALIKSLEGFLTQIAEKALEEARKQHSEKEVFFGVLGANVSFAELGVKWRYENTNDPELADLTAQAAALKKEIDKRGKFLQSLSKPLTIVDEETGEETVVYAAYKTGKSGLKVSFGTDDE